MQLRDGKTKITLNEASASNAPEGESKKDKSLRFINKNEINIYQILKIFRQCAW
jgi:hypothetical protein